MRKEEFREWLSPKIQRRPVNDCLSRCRSVEKALGIDLDEEYVLDGGKRLLQKLQYTKTDEMANRPAPAEFHFADNAQIRFRMANLKSSVNRYFEFLRSIQEN